MPQDQHYLRADRIELPLEPRHLGVPSGVSKMIFSLGTFGANRAPIYTDNITISKWTDARFHMTHVT
jgi:hypothetical protein